MTRGRAGRGGRALWVSVLALVLAGPATVVGPGWRHAQPLGRAFWFPTGPLVSPRAYQTATLLPNGRVLLAGGTNNAAYEVASAELYTPRTDTWTPTGSLTFATEQATATLLRTGKVLVVGGESQFVATTQANLYTPATGTFTDTGYMDIVRVDHTATLLPTGQILIAGGVNDGGSSTGTALASAELYTPATGTFTATASMSTARDIHTATLLPYGGVLVAGGCLEIGGSCNPPVLQSAEVYWYGGLRGPARVPARGRP